MRSFIQRIVFVAAAVPALACSDAVEPELDARNQALSAVPSVNPSATAPGAVLATQISKHPAFKTLSANAAERVGETLAALATLTRADLDLIAERLEGCTPVVTAVCVQEMNALGVKTAPTNAELALGRQLSQAFSLQGKSMEELVPLFGQTQAIADAAGQGTSVLAPSQLGAGAVVCDEYCQDFLTGSGGVPQATVLARLVAGDAGGGGGGGGGGAGGVIAGVLLEMLLDAIKVTFDCIIDPDCYGLGEQDPDEIECRNDSDCDDDEYCADGFLDLGSNECRDKKSNGSDCSTDSQCDSGCCNFNLFGSECATPNKCN